MNRVVALCLLFCVAGARGEETKSRVYYALDMDALGTARQIRGAVVRRMVDSLVRGVTGKATAVEAWRSLVSPGDRVGIKVAAAGRGVSGVHPSVVDAIAAGLREAGIPARNIIVWDRNLDDLVAAGYAKSGPDYTLTGIDPRSGYDNKAIVSAPILGKLIWGDSQFGDRSGSRLADVLSSGDQLSSRSYFAKVLSRDVTKVINVSTMSDSFTTGVNGVIANMTLPNLDNWRRFANACAEGDSYLAELYSDPTIQGKVVLCVMDALVVQYAGGPFPSPNFTVEHFSIFSSRDPVAIDATALRFIEEIRRASRLPSIRPMTAYIDAAEQLGLGIARESRIEIVRAGVEALR